MIVRALENSATISNREGVPDGRAPFSLGRVRIRQLQPD